MLENKKVFVSGGAGVIGTVLVNKLHQMGARVFAGDLKSRPAAWPPEIMFRQGDLNFITKQELERFAPEYFFHLAAAFERTTETFGFWEEAYRHNVRLSHHLMTCLKDSRVLKKIVFASSYLIYNQELYSYAEPAKKARRLKETDPIYPRNLVGAAKLLHEAELHFLNSFRDTGFETVSARIFRGYGKNSRDVISRWIRSLLKGEALTVYNKEGMFDYIYAEDTAEGLIRLCTSPAAGVVNLGNDNARTVAEVLEILRRYFPDMKTEVRDSDLPFEASQANMDYFCQLTGWKPDKQLEDAVPEVIEHESKRRESEELGKADINILVTSVSSKVPLLKALRSASLKLGNRGKIFGADIDAGCIARYFCDGFWQMPRLFDLKIEELIAYCTAKNISCIIPTRDGELRYFAEHRDKLLLKGIRVMTSGKDGVEICLDKLKFAGELQVRGYPVITTELDIEKLADGTNYVVKERHGAGSQSLGLNLTKQEALNHAAGLKEPIFQPFITGREVSVDLYVDQRGKTKGSVVRARKLVVNGESQISVTERNERLEQLCADISEKLGLYAHVVWQVIIDQAGKFHIVECNSRFGGASTLSLASGLDSFYWFLLEATGNDLTAYPMLPPATGRTLVRYAEDLIIP
ncbi:MAG: GDP-L-fucose synthase [Syntrophomonadaceae bacterium]|nr:GDP-L-fucose synthase [Bacillota bacterium]